MILNRKRQTFSSSDPATSSESARWISLTSLLIWDSFWKCEGSSLTFHILILWIGGSASNRGFSASLGRQLCQTSLLLQSKIQGQISLLQTHCSIWRTCSPQDWCHPSPFPLNLPSLWCCGLLEETYSLQGTSTEQQRLVEQIGCYIWQDLNVEISGQAISSNYQEMT